MWNRKRWMTYSMRVHNTMPNTKRPGNMDSGTATEYSAEETDKMVRVGDRLAHRCLVALEFLPCHLG